MSLRAAEGTPADAAELAPEPMATPGLLDSFVEELAILLETEGLPRMAGRIFGRLLVCEPPERTAAQLARELRASGGSISTMTRLLVGSGLVERVSRAGERADRFRITPESLAGLMHAATGRVVRMRRLVGRGLSLAAEDPDASRDRLEEFHDLYVFFEKALPALVKEWERGRTEAGR